MRRALAISLLFLFAMPFLSPILSASAAESSVPMCCRKGGRHQCGLMGSDTIQNAGIHRIGEKCPCAPATLSILLLPSFAPSTAASIFAGITRHPASSPQTDAQLRISFDRTRQKRGPPALLV
jgi:hypothetical protein